MTPLIREALQIVRNAYAAARHGLVTWAQAREVVLNTLQDVAEKMQLRETK